MRFGRICAQSYELSCNLRGRGPIPGFWNDVMALRVEFVTVSLQTAVFLPDRFPRRRNCAWLPGSLLGGTLRIKWSLDPILRICVVGGAKTEIRCLLRRRCSQDSPRSSGNYA